MKRTLTMVFIILLSLALIGGCAKNGGFAVKVNDQAVSRESFDKKMTAYKTYYSNQGVDFEGEQGEATLKTLQSQILEDLIKTALIEQEIAKNKWDVKDTEITKQLEELKAQGTPEDYQKMLGEQALTEQDIINYYTFTANVTRDVKVSDGEIKKFFEANLTKYGGQDEQVKARHILVKTEQEALDIIKQLNAGADFAELAKEKSIDGSKTSGGDLGYFPRGQMVPEFEEAAFSQKLDEFSQTPVKSQFGYHVILVEDHKQAVVPDFAKVSETVEKDALDYAKAQKASSYYTQLRDAAKIEYAEDLKPQETE